MHNETSPQIIIVINLNGEMLHLNSDLNTIVHQMCLDFGPAQK